MVYEFITERREAGKGKSEVVPVRHDAHATGRVADRTDTTGSIMPRPRPVHSHDTLTTTDRQPSWRKPALQQEAELRRPI